MRSLLSLFLILLTVSANAQAQGETLSRIADTGEFRIGFVPDAAPLSFRDADGNVVGYSIELCRRIASATRDHLGLDRIDITFVPLVTIEERISAIENGDIDIECGSTTVTLSRR